MSLLSEFRRRRSRRIPCNSAAKSLWAVIYFALREVVTIAFGLSAGWYLVGLGSVAIATMLFEPAGLWPLLRDRLGVDWLSVRRVPPALAATGMASVARGAAPLT